MRAQPVNIVGAGLAGALLGALLARRGFAVRMHERRPDPQRSQPERGRSINLALAARGIRALERAGIMDRVRPLLIEMRGRMVHEAGGGTALLPYGQRKHEVIYSVDRAALNRTLIEETTRHRGVSVQFDQACLGADLSHGTLRFRDERSGRIYETGLMPTIATDGAGSAVRTSLAAAGRIAVEEEPLDHDYKELTIPSVGGRHVLEPHALHVWPRGGFMLIALPNTDGTFTATLFLARDGEHSFAQLTDPAVIERFFTREFADVVPLMPALLEEFQAHPQGRLGTVHVAPWHLDSQVLLLGDAAHAIVPFHGQGMNAAFEDCSILDELLDRHERWADLFADFETARRPNTQAIAQMAIENYAEMRHHVLDAKFLRRQAMSRQLEQRFADRFIPRYSMVMFHPEIPYAEALRRGAVQAEILETLDQRTGGSGVIDLALARELIESRLSEGE